MPNSKNPKEGARRQARRRRGEVASLP